MPYIRLALTLSAAVFAVWPQGIRAVQADVAPRSLYTYSFGGLEEIAVEDSVELLEQNGYAGIAVEARGEEALERLTHYLQLSEERGEAFNVVAAFMAHRFDQFGFSNAAHRAAIDRIAGTDTPLWIWVRDKEQDGRITNEMVEAFITGIFDYARSKGVDVILYPHYNTYYPTVKDAWPLVRKIDHPSFQIAINLCHEIMSDADENLDESFALAGDKIGAIILSGALNELDRTNVRTMNESTIHSLDESEYDLKPFMRLIRDSGFEGPVGFINFKLTNPNDYLKRSMDHWVELCGEVDLHN